MAGELSHGALRGLLGAYALDALDEDEATPVRRHLEICATCRREVIEHREVAALLASEPVAPPPGPWARIAAAVEDGRSAVASRPVEELPPDIGHRGAVLVPPVAPATRAVPDAEAGDRSSHGGSARRWAAAALGAAAVLLVAVGLLGLVGLRQQHTIHRVESQLADLRAGTSQADAAARAATTPGARRAVLQNSSGTTVAQVVVERDGTAYLIPGDQLSPLGPTRTYQLWGVAGDAKISLGVLGRAPGISKLHVPAHVTALAVTSEVAPGAVAPTNEPAAAGPLRRA